MKSSNGILLLAALLLAALVIVLFSERPPPPNKAIPGLGRMVAKLRQAKDGSESKVASAKARLLPLGWRKGAVLYGDAMAAHNALVSRMLVALGEPQGSFTQAELDTLTSEADEKRSAFYEWYRGGPPRSANEDSYHGKSGKTTSAPIDEVIQLFGIITDWRKMQDAIDREQRDAIRRELSACEWRSWDEIK
jgi:hypothetical protein